MTDEELIEHLRIVAKERDKFGAVTASECAADRIEQLVATNEQLVAEFQDTEDRANAFATKEYHTEMRAKRAEAKLAECLEQNALLEARLSKAVKALREIKAVDREYCTDYFHGLANVVLAELEKTE